MSQAVSSTRNLLKRALAAFEKGNTKEGALCCQEILRIQPQHPKALQLLGSYYKAVGEYPSALEYLVKAINSEPKEVAPYLDLAKVYELQDKGMEAVQVTQQAIHMAPGNPIAHASLVSLFLRFNNAHLVPDYLENVLQQIKHDVQLWQYYCFALKVNERTEEAEKVYDDIRSKYRLPAHFLMLFEFYLPRLITSQAAIDKAREDFLVSVDNFTKGKPQINTAQLSYHPLFQLGFHNRDNKGIVRRYCQMLRLCNPELNYVAPHCGSAKTTSESSPVKVAFISRHMYDHSVGRCYRNLLVSLHENPDFKVTLFMIGNKVDHEIQKLISSGVEVIALPHSVQMAKKVISDRQLDIAVYPDIGMDTSSYYLAMTRLAPYQCCLAGHPDTTGIDTMDYYITSSTYEPKNAQENYTETLLLTDGIDTTFTRPIVPQKWLSRGELGLPDKKKLYVCPMAVQKFHPDFDDILAAILDKDPNAFIVLFNDFQLQSATEFLKRRILAKCSADRILFMDWQPMDRLFSIMKEADALLATIYFGAGTTAQFAFGFGFPIVSWPDWHARSRVVHSYYKVMGIKNAPDAHSAEEYVELAAKLANDKAYHEDLSRQILEKNHLIFDQIGYGERFAQLMKDIMQQNLEPYRQ